MHGDNPSFDRPLSMSVREARMYVSRILLTCGLPAGAVHGVTECVLISQLLGAGGFPALHAHHAEIRMDAWHRVAVTDIDATTSQVDGGELHAWVLLPTILDLMTDVARREGRAELRIRGLRFIEELQIAPHLALRHGALAELSIDGDQARLQAVNTAPPRQADQFDPLLLQALRYGFPVTESLWRDLHALSNGALARDSVLSRRHAGPVILLDDGSVLGRQPSDDDYDPNMLKSVSTSAPPTPSTPT